MFNTTKFLEESREIHLTPTENQTFSSISDDEIKEKLYEFIDIDSPPDSNRYGKITNSDDNKQMFSKALDEICSNIVGNTMFKLLKIKIDNNRPGEKIHLVNYKKNGSTYSPSDFAVRINLSLYNPTKIDKKQYYALDEGKIVLKPKSLAGSIFHEFVHGLHDVSETHKNLKDNTVCIPKTPLEYVWHTDEELKTITGYINDSSYDPICDHIFNYSLHGDTFQPRYGHGGFNIEKPLKDFKQRKNLGNYISYSQKIMNGWKRYML